VKNLVGGKEMTRDAAYDCLKSFGVNMSMPKEWNPSPEALSEFAVKVEKLMKNFAQA
jgi:hypothetical protein